MHHHGTPTLPATPDDAINWIEQQPDEKRRWVIEGTDREKTSFLGILSGGIVSEGPLRTVEIAYAVLSPYRGLGYGGEAVALAIDVVWETFRADLIQALVHADNQRSQRVLLKNGFRLAGPVPIVARDGPETRDLLRFVLEASGA